MLFLCNFTSHGICIDFDNQQIQYLINLYFFVARMGQLDILRSIFTKYFGTFLGFQNYELLDLFSGII